MFRFFLFSIPPLARQDDGTLVICEPLNLSLSKGVAQISCSIVALALWAGPHDLGFWIKFVPVGKGQTPPVDMERHGWNIAFVVDAVDIIGQQRADIAMRHYRFVEVLQVSETVLRTVVLAQPGHILFGTINTDDAAPRLVVMR